MKDHPQERRAYPRANVALKASYKSPNHSGEMKVRVTDLAARGARIYACRPVRRAQPVSLMMMVGKKRVPVQAVVAWSRRTEELGLDEEFAYVWGLQFEHIDNADRVLVAKKVTEAL